MSLENARFNVNQFSPSLLDAGQEYPAQSVVGQIFTADWKLRLLMAGRLWRYSVGTVIGAGAVTGITGGGAGADIDCDEPEIGISVGAGYFLIPVEVMVSLITVDLDTDLDSGDILVTVDRTREPAGETAATNPTMYNMLDGAGSFPGSSYGELTVLGTDPTNEEILDSVSAIANLTTSGLSSAMVRLHYEPSVPSLVAGPCALYVYWGGTAAVTALATVIVGCVPSSWFPIV